jgi:hypothetical protein
VPVLFGLVMGQSSALMLLSFCGFARLVGTKRQLPAGLSLLAWTWKPNLLPVHLVALAATRRWSQLLVLSGGGLALGAAALGLIGPQGAADFLQASSTRWQVAATRLDGYPEGVTLLTIFQDLLGVGRAATYAALAGGLALSAVVAAIWRDGLRSDARRYLQLAVLPIAATLASLHAGVYELTTWLATAWLLLAYMRAVPASRTLGGIILLAMWCSGNLAVVGERTPLLPATVAAGVAVFVALAWLYYRVPIADSDSGQRAGALARERAADSATAAARHARRGPAVPHPRSRQHHGRQRPGHHGCDRRLKTIGRVGRPRSLLARQTDRPGLLEWLGARDDPQDHDQDDRAEGGHHDAAEVEAGDIPAKQHRAKETPDERSQDTQDDVAQKSAATTHDETGQPARDQSEQDPGDETHQSTSDVS